jgi:hypothetical protein
VGFLLAGVAAAHARYEAAEAAIAFQFSTWEKIRSNLIAFCSSMPGYGTAIGLGALALSAGYSAGKGYLLNGEPPDWTRILRDHHPDVRGALGGVLNVGGGSIPSTSTLARRASAIGSFFQGQNTVIHSELASPQEHKRLAGEGPPSCLESMMWRVRGVAGGAKDSSQIAVTKVTAKDGSVSWMVAIPGTESMELGTGRSPADGQTNLQAVAGDTNAIGTAAVMAMAQSGVKKGEPVVMVGHSQGGIAAMALAADPQFAKQFSVKAVMTAGSPLSEIKAPPGVQVVSLEHAQDIIPALSGAQNQHSANHTTVVRDLATSSVPSSKKGATDLGVAHNLVTYAETAKLVDTKGGVSVDAWKKAAAPVMDQQATAETKISNVWRSS